MASYRGHGVDSCRACGVRVSTYYLECLLVLAVDFSHGPGPMNNAVGVPKLFLAACCILKF